MNNENNKDDKTKYIVFFVGLFMIMIYGFILWAIGMKILLNSV